MMLIPPEYHHLTIGQILALHGSLAAFEAVVLAREAALARDQRHWLADRFGELARELEEPTP